MLKKPPYMPTRIQVGTIKDDGDREQHSNRVVHLHFEDLVVKARRRKATRSDRLRGTQPGTRFSARMPAATF